ncbi:CRISPR-associated endonuclease Cas1 [Geitlerinema sp. P-1104]|uniref:CRISPR-associated endonuclease Cas1 n=1 Tax=Geitlerinema sp. P-1104 TaxID=2546230 RepID=UPI001477482D|nr:CRISPR-associated endonuclease Cas1 [Geitlerinema sp. P-1104]NMG59195.1 CRISPR-associated endonuclease Cas1 [Geitlerinema sp. P-1104]
MTTLYLTEPGTVVSAKNQTLGLRRGTWERSCRLAEIDLVVALPGVQLTGAAIALLLDSGVETLFLRRDGRFRGRLQGQFHSNPSLRLAQYRVVETTFGMGLGQKLVLGKIRNQRSLLQRRNRETGGRVTALVEAVDTMAVYVRRLQRLDQPLSRDELMGIEGICAKTYFQAMVAQIPASWGFSGRNRRPPRDPVNALLSWGYGVLLARVFSASVQAGLDPYLGFFHATEPYRPNLVLDLMEEFRPLVVDWVVWGLVRSSVLDRQDFEPSPDGEGVWVGNLAKKLFLEQLERRFQSKLLYPPQERQLALSQIILEQGRAIARACVSLRLDEFESFEVR